MKLKKTQLDEIESVTLSHYENNSVSFWQGTKDHDVRQNYQAFLNACLPDKKLDILDFGCGPGRDLKYFKSLGHRPVGLDGSKAFCKMAIEYTQCEILHQQFLTLALPFEQFDGIFANASLFHVPSQELPGVLTALNKALRPGGILFSSNPRGSGEGWSGHRYSHFIEINEAECYLNTAGFEVLKHYYRPEGLPLDQQPWLAIVSRKRVKT